MLSLCCSDVVALLCRWTWTREEEGHTMFYKLPSSFMLMYQLLILAKLPSSVQKSEAAGYVEELSGVCWNLWLHFDCLCLLMHRDLVFAVRCSLFSRHYIRPEWVLHVTVHARSTSCSELRIWSTCRQVCTRGIKMA